MTATFDYIIVGAGSAGCVLARRLIERKQASVLLLEAGSDDAALYLRMPAGVPKAMAAKTWDYTTIPEAPTLGRRMTVAQGRVVGGSSSVNGMVYIRGQGQDYDAWRDEYACAGWDYRSILPYFRRAEDNETISDAYHGSGGPLCVSDNSYRHPLSKAFLRAGQQAGLRYVVDFNGASQEGVGFYQTTTRAGQRVSAARAYLSTVRRDRRLELVTDALAERILVTEGRARGVVYSRKGGPAVTALARNEVIVAAGAIGSPKLLLLSGIGPTEDLSRHGIAPLVDLPVGRNYQDHLHLSVNAAVRDRSSIDGQDRGLAAVRHGLQWLAFRSGVIASNILEAGAFIDTEGTGRPDVQVHFLPLLDRWDDPDGLTRNHSHGITLKVGHLRPKARGDVTLASADPRELPVVRGNLLGHEDDVAGQIRAAKAALRIAEAPALAALTTGVFSPPPDRPAAQGEGRYDHATLEAWVRRTCKTVYHPIGTCRMGPDPRRSVVDLSLRVHGIDGLRVVDGSIFPAIPSGNTNAPVIAVAEKAADIILANH